MPRLKIRAITVTMRLNAVAPRNRNMIAYTYDANNTLSLHMTSVKNIRLKYYISFLHYVHSIELQLGSTSGITESTEFDRTETARHQLPCTVCGC